MGGVQELLTTLKQQDLAAGHFLGLLHILIGRRIQKIDGTVISTGLTWRELAALLKKVRWDREAVRELGLDPATLPPRDRQCFWYMAIAHAQVDSEKATQEASRLAPLLRKAGYDLPPSPAK
jgi:hypothetical protein